MFRKNEATKVPPNVFGNLAKEVAPSLTYSSHIETQGFYELSGYTGEDLANDVLTVAQLVQQPFDSISFEFIDQFIRIKIGHHVSIESQCIIDSKFIKPNLFVRLIPFYAESDVSEWLKNDVIIEVEYQAYRTRFEEKSSGLKSKYHSCGVQLGQLGLIASIRPLTGNYDNKELCYPPNLRARYWDYQNSEWAKTIRIHNYKIRQSKSSIERPPVLVASQSQRQENRDKNKRDRKEAELQTSEPYVFVSCLLLSFFCLSSYN